MSTISIVTPASHATASVHLLPCHFSHDGPAKISTYFLPQAREGGLEAHLRGRQLAGVELSLPPGVEGVIFRELQGAELVSATAQAEALRGSSSAGGGAAPPPEEEDEGAEYDGLFGGGGMDGSDCGSGYEGEAEERRGGAGAGGGKGGSGGRAGAGAGVGAGAGEAGGASGRVWVRDARFAKITTWQHDQPATDQDMLPRALEWMRVAAALHQY